MKMLTSFCFKLMRHIRLCKPKIISNGYCSCAINKECYPSVVNERHMHNLSKQFSTSSIFYAGKLQTTSTVHNLATFNEIKSMLHDDLLDFDKQITQLLQSSQPELRDMCCYYFDGMGKGLRPVTVFLMAKACNHHRIKMQLVTEKQRKVALISEMIHIASLIHDDIIDLSNIRRGKSSVNYLCGDKNAVMAGNYIMSVVSQLLAEINDDYVTTTITKIIDDLVRGEFMQQDNRNHFDHYLKKTYKKTASLIANCCKASASLSGCDTKVVEASYQFGKNIGIAFQLVDDMLDFVSTSETLGKPAAADLKLGLATAPVLFASEKHPQLNDMITRRFQEEGDVEFALNAVAQSDAIMETQMLADEYCSMAVKYLSGLDESRETHALAKLAKIVIDRTR